MIIAQFWRITVKIIPEVMLFCHTLPLRFRFLRYMKAEGRKMAGSKNFTFTVVGDDGGLKTVKVRFRLLRCGALIFAYLPFHADPGCPDKLGAISDIAANHNANAVIPLTLDMKTGEMAFTAFIPPSCPCTQIADTINRLCALAFGFDRETILDEDEDFFAA